MIKILIYFFLAISLSMDAFVINLSLGTYNPRKKIILLFSSIIGLFHFIMPIFGYYLGSILLDNIIITKYLPSIIFLIIALEMFFTKEGEKSTIILNLITIIFISFSVSIDSLASGVALGLKNENTIIACSIISIVSFIFSYLGLILGKRFLNKQKMAHNIGIILMIIVAIKYICF